MVAEDALLEAVGVARVVEEAAEVGGLPLGAAEDVQRDVAEQLVVVLQRREEGHHPERGRRGGAAELQLNCSLN